MELWGKGIHKYKKILTILVFGASLLTYLQASSYLTMDYIENKHINIIETLRNAMEVSDDRKLIGTDTLRATEASFYKLDERVVVEEFGWHDRETGAKKNVPSEVKQRSYHPSYAKYLRERRPYSYRGPGAIHRTKMDGTDFLQAQPREAQLLSQQLYAKQIHSAALRDGEKTYIISNSQSCVNMTDFVIWIYSAPGNQARRDIIRRTWASDSFAPLNVLVVFGLAAVTNKTQQEWINEESREFSDIVQDGSFIDSYFNLTLKGLSMLRWVDRFCNSSLLLKIDDDTYIIPDRLARWYNALKRTNKGVPKNTIYGLIWMRPGPHRDYKSKYYTSYQVWPNKYYAFLACPGEGYLITTDSIPHLLDQVNQTRFIWLEDMYITGVLAEHAHIYLSGMYDYYLPGSFDGYGGAKDVYTALYINAFIFLVPHVPSNSQLDQLYEYYQSLKLGKNKKSRNVVTGERQTGDFSYKSPMRAPNSTSHRNMNPRASSRMQNFIDGMRAKSSRKDPVLNQYRQ